MPLELLDKIPPIIAALIEAGSGPIFLPYFLSEWFTLAPITEGSTRMVAPLFSGTTFLQ